MSTVTTSRTCSAPAGGYRRGAPGPPPAPGRGGGRPAAPPAAWSRPEFRDHAQAWLDQQLAAAGIERIGEIEQPRVRPWATVLRAPTTVGTVWMKAAGPQTTFEVELYPLLARTVPERVLTPLAADTTRGWVLLPDGGPTLGDRLEDSELVQRFVDALVHYARLQRTLAPHVGDLLALGVADMRPQVMPERFEQALEAAAPYVEQHGDPEARAAFARVGRLPDAVATWCSQLVDSRLPPSLDHNDLHPWNVLDGARFYDWGDSVVAHPFAAMLVPLGFVQRLLDVDLDNAQYVRARDAYLDVFADDAPGEDLASTLALACTVAKIARALTWDRALRAARGVADPRAGMRGTHRCARRGRDRLGTRRRGVRAPRRRRVRGAGRGAGGGGPAPPPPGRPPGSRGAAPGGGGR